MLDIICISDVFEKQGIYYAFHFFKNIYCFLMLEKTKKNYQDCDPYFLLSVFFSCLLSVLGHGGAVDAQTSFVTFLLNNSSHIQKVDSIIIQLWQTCSSWAKTIGPTLRGAVFCSGGLAAKLEEKGKPVPPPQHRDCLAAIEPMFCNIFWLILSLADRPLAENSSSPPGHKPEPVQLKSNADSPTESVTTDDESDRGSLCADQDASADAKSSELSESSPNLRRTLPFPLGREEHGVSSSSNTKSQRKVLFSLLADPSCLANIVHCLNLCPWWHYPAGLPAVSELVSGKRTDVDQLMFIHCQKSALELSKQLEVLPSVLMAVLVTFWQMCLTEVTEGSSVFLRSYVHAVIEFVHDLGGLAPVTQTSHASQLSEPALLVLAMILSSHFGAYEFLASGKAMLLFYLLSLLVLCFGVICWHPTPL